MTDLHKPKISGRGKLAASTSLRGFASIDEAKDAPHEYLCPITLQLMRDPVLLVETGQVYDRESIESWFKSGHSSCPTSGTINGSRASGFFGMSAGKPALKGSDVLDFLARSIFWIGYVVYFQLSGRVSHTRYLHS